MGPQSIGAGACHAKPKIKAAERDAEAAKQGVVSQGLVSVDSRGESKTRSVPSSARGMQAPL
jgi:hypothetical protein